jgi:hypothetical protein
MSRFSHIKPGIKVKRILDPFLLSKTVLIDAWNWILDSETGGLAVRFYFIFYFIANSVQ